MIKERTIEQAADGSYFATNAVTLIYEDMDGQHEVFFIAPDGLYEEVRKGVSKMSSTDTGDTSNMTPEMKLLKEQMVKVMRAGVKGIFMMWGEKLLTLFYGTSNHPRPPKDKHLDLVNWYLDEFTKVLIAHMMKNDIVLKGQRTEVNGRVISVDEVATRPVTSNAQAASDTRNEQGATEQSNSN